MIKIGVQKSLEQIHKLCLTTSQTTKTTKLQIENEKSENLYTVQTAYLPPQAMNQRPNIQIEK